MTEFSGVGAVIAAQRRALLARPVPYLAQRKEMLQRLKRLLARNANDLAAAMDRDFGGRDQTFPKMNFVLA